ncbi:NAD(P)-dependent oxidoreductase [Afifella sp. IM 167]|uniref:NAD-dependent epimerase/dehydratase family protein n=1 Tax=Afifella sp. IM 167 TaxID=2033586 RepID=UPI001CC977BC|nr:NAD(P)-dependent oxidoreductase [Afifella sp. IM 167]MBZ8135162.1 nucleoside-diphosphate sugar epimerase [Afifella sp. IM 167]
MEGAHDTQSLGPVLVTGATGFLGAWLIAALLERGETVHALDIVEDRRLLLDLAGQERAGEVAWAVADVTDAAQVEKAVARAGARAVVHLAALTIPPCREDPARGVAVNVIGHVNVLEAARRNGAETVLYTSSAASHPRGPLNAPANVYGVTKRAVEDISKVYFLDHGLATIGLRPNVVYGLGRAAGETAAISEAIRAAAEGRRYTIPYASSMCFQYVEEVVEVMLRCLAARPDGPIVSDITVEQETVDDLLAAIRAVEPGAQVDRADRHRPSPDVPLDDAPLRALIGTWRHVPLEEGVRRTIERHRARLETAA